MGEIGSGGGSSYPGALDINNNLEVNSPNAGKTKARAEVPNDLAAAAVAIENELGVNPAGSEATVVVRLDNEHGSDGTHSKDFTHPLKWTESGDEYIRVPRLTTTERDALSPVDGFFIFNTTDSIFQVFHDSSWNDITDSATVVSNIRDVSRGLVSTAPSAATVDIDADEISLQDGSGNTKRVTSVNLTIDIEAANGANALDTGSEANSTWYYIWVIDNGSTTAGLFSLSPTAPIMPSGYTFKGLIGAVRNDGSGNFLDFTQIGTRVNYDVLLLIKNGSFTTAAWTAQDITSMFPVTAKVIKGYMGVDNNHIAMSPRSDGHAGHYHRSTGPVGSETFAGVLTTGRNVQVMFEIPYADTVFYFTQAAGSTLNAVGWEY